MRRRAALLVAVAVLAGFLAWLASDDPGHPRDARPASTGAARNPLRIVALGTSLTARAEWPDDLERRLAGCARVEVIRHAQPGAGSGWGLAQAEKVTRLDPALVIVELAMNDADWLDGIPRAESRRLHLALADALRAGRPDVTVIFLTTNPVSGLARLQRPFLSYYYGDYVEIARMAGAGLVDGYRRWLDTPDWPALIPDGVHPDPQAESAVFAPALAAAVADGLGLDCPGSGSP